MPTSEPFDADEIISLWTQLLELQVNIGYYPNDDCISFPPPEGRTVNEALCQQLRLTDDVITLLKRLPCPKDFDEARDTEIVYDTMAVPFTEDEWILNSRDHERCLYSDDDMPHRPDLLKPEELALLVATDEAGYHLILDTKANTARLFRGNDTPYDPVEGEEGTHERPDDRWHYRNYTARPAVEVLEELLNKFRDLQWIPCRYEGRWQRLVTSQDDESKEHPNAYTNAKIILRHRFGWPDNFKTGEWNKQKDDIWTRLLEPDPASLPVTSCKELDNLNASWGWEDMSRCVVQ